MVVKDFFLPLLETWEEYAHRLPDYMRPLEFLASLITRQDTVFVKLGPSWIIFVGAGDNISVIILGEPEPKQVRKVFKKALDATKSIRLSVFVPASAADYFSLLREIGFKMEGRLRQAQTYNGELGDALILGFLASAKKGRKRKRRSRRGGKK